VSDTGWKQLERCCARALGVERSPVTGDRDGADFRDGMFASQAKKGRRFSPYLTDWLRGIRGTADRGARVGEVIWQDRGKSDADAVVVLAFTDGVELHGRVRDAPGDDAGELTP
jgi:hypothetical protein